VKKWLRPLRVKVWLRLLMKSFLVLLGNLEGLEPLGNLE
jgi:hypothetical protein